MPYITDKLKTSNYRNYQSDESNSNSDYDYNEMENVKNFNYDSNSSADNDESTDKQWNNEQEHKSSDEQLVKIKTFKNPNEKLNQEIAAKNAEYENKFEDNLCKLKNDSSLFSTGK
jgi:hypothetical protein